MARIIESGCKKRRRIIKMTTNDIISVIREYQRIVPRGADLSDVRSYLDDTVIYIPEDI